jgi:hypothetical protein
MRTYGGSGNDAGWSVAGTADGGFIIAGETYSYGAGGSDVYLVRADAGGDTIWTRTYGGGADDTGWSAVQTDDGGFIVAGQTYSFGSGGYDIYLIRTDADGDTLWTRTYGGSEGDAGRSIREVQPGGGFIIAGHTNSYGGGIDNDVLLVRTDAAGDVLWTRVYGGADDEAAWEVATVPSGGYAVAGETYSYGAGGADVYLLRLDAAGDTLWTGTYGGSGWDIAYSVGVTSDGGYIVAGETDSYGAGYADFFAVKVAGCEASTGKVDGAGDAWLLSAYPNPLTASTRIRLVTPEPTDVLAVIYDTRGRAVATLADRTHGDGVHILEWDGTDTRGRPVAQGVYYCRVQSDGRVAAAKILVAR